MKFNFNPPFIFIFWKISEQDKKKFFWLSDVIIISPVFFWFFCFFLEPLLRKVCLINEDNSHLSNDWRVRWQERAGSRSGRSSSRSKRPANQRKKESELGSFFFYIFGFVFCVTRPWYLLCCGRCALPVSCPSMDWLLLSFFSSLLLLLTVGRGDKHFQQLSSYSHLTSLSLLRRLVFSFYSFLHFQSRFYGDIPRNYMLISCGLSDRVVFWLV